MAEQKQRLTVGEVFHRTGISVSTLDGWRSNGLGPPSVRVDGRVHYDVTSLDAWFETYRARQKK